MSRKCIPLEERFWPKVNKTSGCWLWTACKDENGYGQISNKGGSKYAHIISYELINGKVPEGLELDHLCRTPACVRPDHLEPVTHRVNCLRGVSPLAEKAKVTHCPQGHPYDVENTLFRPSKLGRDCKQCNRERRKKNYRKKNPVEKGHFSILTESQVLLIRTEYVSEPVTYSFLANKYGVSAGTISDVIKRRTWKTI